MQKRTSLLMLALIASSLVSGVAISGCSKAEEPATQSTATAPMPKAQSQQAGTQRMTEAPEAPPGQKTGLQGGLK